MRRSPPAFLVAGLLAALAFSFEASPAAAQSRPEEGAAKPAQPARPQIPPAKNKGAPALDPALRAECAWTGQRIISLLWRDDVNTAREQSRFYEMFGCPASHLPAAFRCVIEQSQNQPEQNDLTARVYGCWMSPEARDQQD